MYGILGFPGCILGGFRQWVLGCIFGFLGFWVLSSAFWDVWGVGLRFWFVFGFAGLRRCGTQWVFVLLDLTVGFSLRFFALGFGWGLCLLLICFVGWVCLRVSIVDCCD